MSTTLAQQALFCRAGGHDKVYVVRVIRRDDGNYVGVASWGRRTASADQYNVQDSHAVNTLQSMEKSRSAARVSVALACDALISDKLAKGYTADEGGVIYARPSCSIVHQSARGEIVAESTGATNPNLSSPNPGRGGLVERLYSYFPGTRVESLTESARKQIALQNIPKDPCTVSEFTQWLADVFPDTKLWDGWRRRFYHVQDYMMREKRNAHPLVQTMAEAALQVLCEASGRETFEVLPHRAPPNGWNARAAEDKPPVFVQPLKEVAAPRRRLLEL